MILLGLKNFVANVLLTANILHHFKTFFSKLNSKLSSYITTGTANGGTYYKFSNGLLICSKRISYYVNGSFSAWGNVYETPSISLGNWPHAFKSTPTATMTVQGGNTGLWTEGFYSLSATSCGTTYLCRGTSSCVAHTAYIQIIAVGTWK